MTKISGVSTKNADSPSFFRMAHPHPLASPLERWEWLHLLSLQRLMDLLQRMDTFRLVELPASVAMAEVLHTILVCGCMRHSLPTRHQLALDFYKR